MNKSPVELGFRMPAEWEKQEAVWFSWPVNRSTWPEIFESIPLAFAKMVAAVTRFEEVRINCPHRLQEIARGSLMEAKTDLERVRFFDHETDDAWCRDHGPIFLRNDMTGEVAVTDWQYNAWGGKYPPFDNDNRIPEKIAAALGLRRFSIPVVLEGGSIEVDGQGQLLTTEACLLNPNRNPHLSRAQIEEVMAENLGVRHFLWLRDGIVGDDTDGHIDDICRFFRPDALVAVREENPRDDNYRILKENEERLSSFRTAQGKPFELCFLPMPDPVWRDNLRLPASYANYLVINDAVLVPAFRQPHKDGCAREILGHCFPGREILLIDCLDLVLGLGTVHCVSQQQPA
ncbi:MAG: agmatine deiminase family protein [Opitutales bacterium]